MRDARMDSNVLASFDHALRVEADADTPSAGQRGCDRRIGELEGVIVPFVPIMAGGARVGPRDKALRLRGGRELEDAQPVEQQRLLETKRQIWHE